MITSVFSFGQTLLATETEVLEKVKIEIEDDQEWSLVVFNDDVNTFDFVIDTLMEVCGHTIHQAEQCTLLIHHKGKCAVKNGNYDEMATMCKEILRRGISAEVM